MNIIIGITRIRGKMRIQNKLLIINGIIVVFLLMSGCKSRDTKTTNVLKLPLPAVTVAHPEKGNKILFTYFQGISKYLQSVNYRARAAGIVTHVFIRPGDPIQPHQPLFILKPVELTALENSGTLSKKLLNSRDTVFSTQAALTNNIAVQEGDYVQPGGLLATAFKKNSLVAIGYVPFHDKLLLKQNKNCLVIIPGAKAISSTFKKPLFIADSTSQTQPYIIPLPSNLMIPSNMNLRIRYIEKEIKNGLFIPRTAVLSNVMETKFWVMKMKNDTTAVKIPVVIGWQGKTSVQVSSDNIKPIDKVITQGAYGMPDTAYVRIINRK